MLNWIIGTAAACVLVLGIIELQMAFQWPDDPPDWTATEGWLTDIGAEYAFQLPGKKAKAIKFLIQDQHVSFVFFDKDNLIFKRLELPPNLAPVRAILNKTSAAPEDWDDAFDPNSEELPGARWDDKLKRLEVLTERGMTLSSNIGGLQTTNHLGAKWEAVPKEAWDQYLPRVKLKYNPKDPNQCITTPDILNGRQTLLWSGVTFVVAAFLIAAGLIFHHWVTKPEELELPDPLARRRL